MRLISSITDQKGIVRLKRTSAAKRSREIPYSFTCKNDNDRCLDSARHNKENFPVPWDTDGAPALYPRFRRMTSRRRLRDLGTTVNRGFP